MAGLVPAIHVFTSPAGCTRKTWMPGIADKFTQSAQFRLLWPGMTRRVSPLLLPNAYDKIDVTEVRHGS
jgi:hypothetical protein